MLISESISFVLYYSIKQKPTFIPQAVTVIESEGRFAIQFAETTRAAVSIVPSIHNVPPISQPPHRQTIESRNQWICNSLIQSGPIPERE